jgi:tetratricopeptide (TPR) repeat protein
MAEFGFRSRTEDATLGTTKPRLSPKSGGFGSPSTGDSPCQEIEKRCAPPEYILNPDHRLGDSALGSMLKALGLTIWGLIAFGLLAVFIFMGYEAALKYRASSGSVVDASTATPQSREALPVPPASIEALKPAASMPVAPASSPFPLTLDATHQLLRSAAEHHQYDMAIEYGHQLVDSETAGPDDLLTVAQSYFSINDCGNARIWVEKAKEAFRAAGRESNESLHRITMGCGADHDKPRTVLDTAQKERMARLLNALKVRAQADREKLPLFEAEAAQAQSGGPYVRLGELYYGFGDYEHAIASIQRGLEKGKVAHLDDAYVYLGLSEQVVGDLREARKAFAKLKDVPGISPRVLLLWTLYAETQLAGPSQYNSRAADTDTR